MIARACAVAAAALLALAPAALADRDASPVLSGGGPGRVELSDIEDEVMCPICGTLLELSEAPQADRERAFIRRLIARGHSKEQIKDALVAEFGEEVLATPDDSGFGLAAWVVPVAALVLAAGALLLAVRRWRRQKPGPAADAAPSKRDSERLDSDLARYDL